jgi:ligand-binding sensor domain-containing protein
MEMDLARFFKKTTPNKSHPLMLVTMKFMIFYLTVFTVLASCNGNGQSTAQHANATKPNELFAFGETNKDLSNNIMVIYQDLKNNYWFGSWQDGLYKYDGKSILHYTTIDGLPDNRVEDIKEDKLGNIYINTSKGLCQYTEEGNRFLTLSEALSAESDWNLKSDDLWFKCLEHPGYVYRLDGSNLYKLKFPTSKLGEDYILKHPTYPNPYAIYCIYKDSKQNIWFGTATLGVCRYNGKSFDWISEKDVTEIHDGPANGVRSIAEDKNGDFWFNTEYRYSIYNKKPSTKTALGSAIFYERIKSIGCLDGKKDGALNEYLSITKDDDNNLWIATYLHGVWKFDGKEISHYPIQVNAQNIPIYRLYKDNTGVIWLGTHENGAFKFNGKTFEKFAL